MRRSIFLEGVIPANARTPEGPFGEYTGYATSRSTNNLFCLRAITHRAQAYFLDVCPGQTGVTTCCSVSVQKEVEVLRNCGKCFPM